MDPPGAGLQDYESNKSKLAGPIDFDAALGKPALALCRVIFDYHRIT